MLSKQIHICFIQLQVCHNTDKTITSFKPMILKTDVKQSVGINILKLITEIYLFAVIPSSSLYYIMQMLKSPRRQRLVRLDGNSVFAASAFPWKRFGTNGWTSGSRNLSQHLGFEAELSQKLELILTICLQDFLGVVLVCDNCDMTSVPNWCAYCSFILENKIVLLKQQQKNFFSPIF